MAKLFDLDTPALIVDIRILENNLDRMQKYALENRVSLRPHTKTHKTTAIAKMQQERGAVGICVAKTGEAEVFAEAGFKDILIATEVVGLQKIERIFSIAERAKMTVLVDSRIGISQLSAVGKRRGQSIDVLIEIDTGDHRCGVSSVSVALELARAIEKERFIRLRGLLTHEGHVYQLGADQSIEALAKEATDTVNLVAAEIRGSGIDIDVVSMGSTPTAPYLLLEDGVNEIRPGSYGLNDMIQVGVGSALIDNCAATILATVMSRDSNSGRFVLDSGSKTLFSDVVGNVRAMPSPYSGYGFILGLDARIEHLSEEHGVAFSAAGEACPKVGTKLRLIPNHICACANLHDKMYVVDGEKVVGCWPISARGKVQ